MQIKIILNLRKYNHNFSMSYFASLNLDDSTKWFYIFQAFTFTSVLLRFEINCEQNAGANGIGVAPEATWIACKGCSGSSCDTSALLRCGEWVQCPTDTQGNNRNCNQAPQVVCNSWGGGGNSNFYDRVIDSWQRAGITPVFAIGNAGPNCNTGGSPGDRQNVIAVGDTDSSQRISRTSSLGPAGDGRLKPDISAPGTQIRSAWHTGDNAYNTISGTSMAAPHVTGVVVLMKNKRSSLSYQQIYNAVTSSANTQMDTRNARTCGNRPGNRFPNNVFGYGEIDAVRSVNAV